jgi:hypothetical protein
MAVGTVARAAGVRRPFDEHIGETVPLFGTLEGVHQVLQVSSSIQPEAVRPVRSYAARRCPPPGR